jgi:hypothetical protein
MDGSRSAIRLAACAALLATTIVGLSATAAASSSKSTKGTTKHSTAALGAGAATPNVTCPSKNHATGGGFSVSEPYDPGAKSGAQTIAQTDYPSGKTKWRAGASVFQNEPTATETTYVRCEKNSFGTINARPSASATVSVGTSQTLIAACPFSAQVVGGGYTVAPLFESTAAPGSTSRMIILQSRRSGTRTWSVTGLNNSTPPSQLTAYALCEKSQSGSGSITEKNTFAALQSNSRGTVTATCGNKKHAVAGGFSVTPTTLAAGAPVVDVSMPSGSKSWVTGAYVDGVIPSSSVTGYAYCKPNKKPS